MKTNLTLIALILLILPSLSHAKQELDQSGINWITTYGFSFGGAEDVRSLYNPYADRFEVSGLAFLGAGVELKIKGTPFTLQTLVTSQFDQADAQRGDASFDYHTVDTLAFIHKLKHRLGAGITHHYSPQFYLDSQSNNITQFENARGLALEYNYSYNKKTAVGLRFTDINYQPLFSDKSTDGGNLNIFIKTYY